MFIEHHAHYSRFQMDGIHVKYLVDIVLRTLTLTRTVPFEGFIQKNGSKNGSRNNGKKINKQKNKQINTR